MENTNFLIIWSIIVMLASKGMEYFPGSMVISTMKKDLDRKQEFIIKFVRLGARIFFYIGHITLYIGVTIKLSGWTDYGLLIAIGILLAEILIVYYYKTRRGRVS